MSDTPTLSFHELSQPSLPRSIEESLRKKAGLNHFVIGVDEAGRGPLAGPVVAAAFAFLVPGMETPGELLCGVTDSKQVSEEAREFMFYSNLEGNPRVAFKTSIVDNREIDEINILQATFKAMSTACMDLMEDLKSSDPKATFSVLVDGNKIPSQLAGVQSADLNLRCVIKGDSIEFVIAAASICAKVTRDEIMRRIDDEFPLYGFRQHKGYPTGAHVAAISRHGACKYHRMTFGPLKRVSRKKKLKSEENIDIETLSKTSARDERAKRRSQMKSN